MQSIGKLCGMLFLSLAILGAPRARAQQAKDGRTLQVHVNYTGSGSVDASHKIYVVLWDTPSFTQGGAMPLELKPVSSKDGTAVFTGVAKNPVYISSAYDPSGQWDGQSGPPPTGTSLGLYSKEPGKPEPINVDSGKTANITMSFDDSYKMQ